MKDLAWSTRDSKLAYKMINHASNQEIEEVLGRKIDYVRKHLKLLHSKNMMPKFNKRYSSKEDSIIMDLYGEIDTELIAEKLYRSKQSIVNRSIVLFGSTDTKENNGYYDTTDVCNIMGITRPTAVKHFKNNSETFSVINNNNLVAPELFWDWLELNLDKINASNINFDNLYHCPNWYKNEVNKRKKESINGLKKGKISEGEVVLIKHLRKKGLTLQEIGLELNRPRRAIKMVFEREKKKDMLK